MRKLITLSFFSLFFLTFQSCSDNDSPDISVNKDLILGEWVLKDVYSKNGTVKITANGRTIKGNITVKGKNYNNVQKFTENPNKLISTGGMTITTTTSIAGRSETIEQEIPDQTLTGEWSINGNKLTSSVSQYSNLVSTITIDKLTESSLILNQNLSDSEQFIGLQGIKMTGNLFFIYEKK